MSDSKDVAVAFGCYAFRGCLVLGLFFVALICWNAARAQTAVEFQVQCKDGKCLIAEKDLERLLESNDRAVLEVVKLRKSWGGVRV